MKRRALFAALFGMPVAAQVNSFAMPMKLVPHREIFRVPSLVFPLSYEPAIGWAEAPRVYLNGLLMTPGDDYTIAGQTLTFTGQAVDQMTDVVVNVFYWTANVYPM